MTGWADLLPESLVATARDACLDALEVRHGALCDAATDPGSTVELFDRLVDEYVDARKAVADLDARRRAEMF